MEGLLLMGAYITKSVASPIASIMLCFRITNG